MSVRFSVSGAQIRQLKAVLHCLGKVGPDLLVEALPQKLILRDINTSQSAYASVTLHNAFFDAYDVFDSSVVQTGVLIKHMLALFRTQRIFKLGVHLDTESSKLVATLLSESGLEKQYQVPCMEARILQANLERDAFPTCVIAAASELNRLLGSFQNNLEEITIIATPDDDVANGPPSRAVQLHSFVDPLKSKSQHTLHTQLAVDTHEVFLSYQHSADAACDVTFNLRDFKAMLTLCEALNADVAIRFGQPGSPLVVEPHLPAHVAQEAALAAELVLATLLETARPGDAGPATVARNAAGRLDTPGGGHIPGDTPWARQVAGVRQQEAGTAAARPSRFAQQAAPGIGAAGAPFLSGIFAQGRPADGKVMWG
ncbi:hypothetical protein WJX81_008024 [Elliptochloris bilobata]|uniref:Uncharacterized protein n=1 Tax=Elliptochloris bilobata TaxID=381761 RepID=A0AAW1RQB8_9CHLO